MLIRHDPGQEDSPRTGRRLWCGGRPGRGRRLRRHARAHRAAVRHALHARFADAAGGGRRARGRPPDRLPDVPDADPPLHLPAGGRRRVPGQPRLRSLRRCGRGGGLLGGGADLPQGRGGCRGVPGLRALGGVLVAGRDRRGLHPERPLRGPRALPPAPVARAAGQPGPADRGLLRRPLADPPPVERAAAPGRRALRRPRGPARLVGGRIVAEGGRRLRARPAAPALPPHPGADGRPPQRGRPLHTRPLPEPRDGGELSRGVFGGGPAMQPVGPLARRTRREARPARAGGSIPVSAGPPGDRGVRGRVPAALGPRGGWPSRRGLPRLPAPRARVPLARHRGLRGVPDPGPPDPLPLRLRRRGPPAPPHGRPARRAGAAPPGRALRSPARDAAGGRLDLLRPHGPERRLRGPPGL